MMKYSSLKILTVYFMLILVLAVSCTRDACFDETNAYLKASFYLSSTQKLLAPDSLTLYGTGRDTSKIYNKTSSIIQALIPLNSSTGNCGFIIRINGVSDTLFIRYTPYPHLLSQECGYTYYYTLDSVAVTKNIVDTITVPLKKVSTLNGENIRIYY
ncbi:MAG: hypothetical protein QG576_290 [Bacteroidota bacterium]|nr:hypothetical protein [Bacteroidota bacterium]